MQRRENGGTKTVCVQYTYRVFNIRMEMSFIIPYVCNACATSTEF